MLTFIVAVVVCLMFPVMIPAILGFSIAGVFGGLIGLILGFGFALMCSG